MNTWNVRFSILYDLGSFFVLDARIFLPSGRNKTINPKVKWSVLKWSPYQFCFGPSFSLGARDERNLGSFVWLFKKSFWKVLIWACVFAKSHRDFLSVWYFAHDWCKIFVSCEHFQWSHLKFKNNVIVSMPLIRNCRLPCNCLNLVNMRCLLPGKLNVHGSDIYL